jgi:hypothetical protein
VAHVLIAGDGPHDEKKLGHLFALLSVLEGGDDGGLHMYRHTVRAIMPPSARN